MIKRIVKKIILSIRESRNPVLFATRILSEVEIKTRLKINKKNHVHISGAVMWDHLQIGMWGDGNSKIWQFSKNLNSGVGRLMPRNFKFELLSQLVEQNNVINWETDISQLHGFSNSKSNLDEFESLHQLVLTNSRGMIKDISEDGLIKNLSHREIRIINSTSTGDHFVRYAWDGRLYLVNAGGSHHLAAAKYIAFKLDKPVKLKANYVEYYLNREVLKQLVFDYRIFLFDGDDDFVEALITALTRVENNFIITNLSSHICPQGKLLFLFNKYKETKLIGDVLVKKGLQDIGALLLDQYGKQKRFYKPN